MLPGRGTLRRALRVVLGVGGALAIPAPYLPVRIAGVLVCVLGATLPIWSAPPDHAPPPLRIRQRHRRIVGRAAYALLATAAGLALAQGHLTAPDDWLLAAALALPTVEPLLWRAWPLPLRDAVRRVRNAELYTEAMQRQTPPPLPPRAQAAQLVPGRAVRGLAPPAVRVAPTAGFDVDAGARGRPRSRTARVKAQDHGPTEVHVGPGLLRWNGAELTVRSGLSGRFERLFLEPEPMPAERQDGGFPRFPDPVAELVLFTQRANEDSNERNLFLVLLDARGYRMLLRLVPAQEHRQARRLAATLRARVGLTVNEYHLPVLEGARRSLGPRLFPRRPWI